MATRLVLPLCAALTAAAQAGPAPGQTPARDTIPAPPCGPESPADACLAPAPAGPGVPGGEQALVLSGGGSRGLAHPGALEGLEAQGFDPGIVVGTSIGALVGALYAVGHPAEEIQRQMRAVDWGELFTPAPVVLGPERSVRYPLLSIDRQTDPLRFNRGFVPQWRMNRALVRLLFDAEARSRGDFDRLARRFRTVGTDLRTGDAVIIGSGDLARAVRASLAVPGVFAPVEWDGRTLVDGGVADNLPLAAARAAGGRYLVAVDVGQPAPEVTSRGPLAVASRALDLLQENAQRDSLPPDVWIVPRLPPNFAGATFPDDPRPLFSLGREAARGVRVQAGTGGPRTIPAPPGELVFLHVEAPDSALARYARRALGGIVPGPYQARRLLDAVDRLHTTGLFEGAWPRVEESLAGPGLVLRLEAPPRLSVSGAAGYDSDRFGRAWLALQQSMAVGGAPATGVFSALATGLEQSASAEVRVYPVGIAPLVVGSGLAVRESDVRFVRPGSDLEVMRVVAWASVEGHRLLSERVGALVLHAERVSFGGRAGMAFGPLLRFAVPQSEPPVVGVTTLAEAEARWGDFRYRRLRARGALRGASGPLRAAVLADLTAVSGDAPPDLAPTLGEEHLVPGYRWGEPRGDVRAVAGVDVAHRALGGGYLRMRLRAGAVADDLPALWDAAPWAVGGELGVMYRTPFGAFSAGVGTNTRSEPRVVLDLGSAF